MPPVVALNHDADIPLTALSFQAFRLKRYAGSGYEEPRSFLNLGHWFEAEKFRAFSRERYDEICMSPSLKESRKFAKRHAAYVRGDWLAVCARVLACGMVYAARADQNSIRWSMNKSTLIELLKPMDMPVRHVEQAVEQYLELRTSPRLMFLGGARVSDDAVGRRVYHVNKTHDGAWRLTHWLGRHSSWAVHDWAVLNYVPIAYLGEEKLSIGARETQLFQHHCDSVVIFDVKGQRTLEPVTKHLKAFKIPVQSDVVSPPEADLLG
jgi:hypothetical protein